jgi:nucleoside-diphosphate-sugar epimerase
MPQRVLVLGAHGFIGRRMVAALAASDWGVPVAAGRRVRPDAVADSIVVDATDADALEGALAGIDGVINCVAGEADVIGKNAAALFGAAARLATPPRIVHLSSMAAYGSSVGLIEESAPLLGDWDPYSHAKAAAEAQAVAYSPSVILRPGIVYGPGSPWWSDRIARLLVAYRLGDLGARGDGWCNLVHVDDVAKAALLALRTPMAAGQAFNIASPSPPTWNAYFQRYAKALGAVPVRRISGRRLTAELKLAAPALKLLELGARFTGGTPPPPIRPWLLRLCAHEMRLAVGKAEELLGMQWLDLDVGLGTAAAWFRRGGRT